MADISLIVDYNTVKQANQEILKIGSTAQKSASVFEKSFSRAERSQKAYLSSVRQQIAFSQKMERQKARESAAAVKAAKAMANEEERLKGKYIQGYNAMSIYSKELNDIGMARKRDIITADQQKEAVQRLNTAMATGTGAFAGFGNAAQVGGRRVNSSGMLIQQAGYQFGDFAVQVQGGTNFMVAFGQQATQMIGAFNMLPAATLAASVGVGAFRISVLALIASLGVIIPVLTAVGAYFMRSRAAAKAGAEGIKTYADVAKAAREEIKKTRLETEALNKGFRDTQELSLQQGIAAARANLSAARARASQLSGVGREAQVSVIEGQASELEKEVQKREEILRLLLEQRATQEALDRGMEARQQMLENEAELLREREEVVAGIRDYMSSQSLELSNQIALMQVELQYGKDSAELSRVQALQARDAFIAEQERNGILGNNLEEMLEIYDAHVKVTDELEESNRSSEEMLANQEALKEGAEGFLAIWQSILGVVKETNDNMGGGTTLTDSQYQQMLYYQQYAETLTAAPKEPPKPPSVARGSTVGSASTISTAAADSLNTYKAALKEVMALEAERTALVEPMARAFTDGFTSMVDGTMKVKDAFKAMALDIVKHLWKIFVVEQMVNSITGAFGIGGITGMTMTPKANPLSGLSGSQLLPNFAGGGYTGDGSRSGGMDGQGGYLAMLHPRETVVDHTKGQATGGDTINISQSFNFSANGDESVKKIIAQAAPQIAQMTQKSMMDQRRRGGAMKSTFG